jgi:hypothetical protein
VEGKAGGEKANEGPVTEQESGNERTYIDKEEKTKDRNAYRSEDGRTGLEEEIHLEDENDTTAQLQQSPKRIKKLKMEKEAQMPRGRTRSKTRTRIT